MSRALLVALWIAVAAALPAAVTSALAKDPIYTGTFSSLAVSGYDPVAYFTQGKPVKGRSDLQHEWQGATWRFADAANLAAFKADPEAYAPQYGGYCAYAMSRGWIVSTDPEAWAIHDGKLYLNYSTGVRRTWLKDVPGYVERADRHWADKTRG